MAVLYRRFRPQSFEEVVGQDHVVQTLQNALRERRFAHAYLFAGPRGVGKTTLARLLAKSLNCGNFKSGSNFPCQKCTSCLELVSGTHLDVIEIDAASNRGIDEIRNLREKVKFTPQRGLYKIYIIDEAHMLTKEAFNALLKTLEEPPAHAVFVLATTEPHKLPLTIISRCQRFDFHLAKDEDLFKVLKRVAETEDIEVENEAYSLLIESAQGSYRDGIRILEQISTAGNKKITRDLLIKILGWIEPEKIKKFFELIEKRKASQIFAALKDFKERGVDWGKLIERLLFEAREKLLASVEKNESEQIGENVNLINLLISAERSLKTLSLPEVALEAASAQWLTQNPKTESNPATSKVEDEANPASVEGGVNWWRQISDGLKSHNHSLSGLLKGLSASLQGETLTVEVNYDFHRDKIESPNNRRAIEDQAHKVLKKPVTLKVLKTPLAEVEPRQTPPLRGTGQVKQILNKDEIGQIFSRRSD